MGVPGLDWLPSRSLSAKALEGERGESHLISIGRLVFVPVTIPRVDEVMLYHQPVVITSTSSACPSPPPVPRPPPPAPASPAKSTPSRSTGQTPWAPATLCRRRLRSVAMPAKSLEAVPCRPELEPACSEAKSPCNRAAVATVLCLSKSLARADFFLGLAGCPTVECFEGCRYKLPSWDNGRTQRAGPSAPVCAGYPSGWCSQWQQDALEVG